MSSDLPQPPVPGVTPANHNLPEAVYRLYAALAATLPLHAEFGLGGKLLYAGAMRGVARNLLFAANIAGAASLAASADPGVQRLAMRDGVVDFVVTSLEEALRILKNEIRKRQAVSVGVTLAPEQLVMQMLDRGVLPDMLPPFAWSGDEAGLTPEQAQTFLAQGALQVVNVDEGATYASWSVDRDFSRWLPRIDACAKSLFVADDRLRGRWLRLAPRYLGRLMQRQHGVVLSEAETALLRDEVRRLLASHGEEGIPVVEIAGVPVA
jgi:hypothetical protein